MAQQKDDVENNAPAAGKDKNDSLGTIEKIVAIIGGIAGIIFILYQIFKPPPPPPTPPPPTPTPTPPPPVVEIVHIEYDPPQPQGEEDWQHEFVSLRNTTAESQEMSYWTLEDADGRAFNFPEFTLAPGASVKLWTGEGTDSDTDLYWNCRQSIWDNEGPDMATLKDHRGDVVDQLGYAP